MIDSGIDLTAYGLKQNMIHMRDNENRQDMGTPSESQTNRAANMRDVELDRMKESGGAPAEELIQSDASGKAFYQTAEEYEKDKSRDPQKGDPISISKIDERDTKTDEYRNSKLSDTEIGGE